MLNENDLRRLKVEYVAVLRMSAGRCKCGVWQSSKHGANVTGSVAVASNT